MKTINIQKQERVRLLLYPDNQPHVIVNDIQSGDEVRVVAPIRSSLEMMQLLEVANALSNLGATKSQLVIPYLMGARSDRIMLPGDSFDLEVIAGLINGCGFESVNLFDVHSPVATQLIKNSKSHNNIRLVNLYSRLNSVLICPDKGAMAKTDDYAKWNWHITDLCVCEKERDLSTGRITLRVLNPEICADRDCVIIDDICDGGGTFLAIAGQISPKTLTLMVSHGIFSKGFRELEKHFTEIFTTDSYGIFNDSKILTTLPLDL